jgi:hypothetical protein
MKNTIRLTMVLVAALACAPAFAANTGSFTLSTKANGDGTLTPTLTWSTTPAATSCAASGNAAWSGTKAASGTLALAPVPTNQPQAYALVCDWPGDTQALLTWTPPTENTDSSALTNLAGFRVKYGTSQGSLTQVVDVPGAGVTSYKVTGLTTGTYYFGVLAYTSAGAESSLSNLVSKTIDATAIQWSQQAGFKVPKAPSAGGVN